MTDDWVGFQPSETLTFYDIVPFNSDTFDVNKDFKPIAEMYFRVDVDEMLNVRKVFSFVDFLGSIGGIVEILARLSAFILGGYLSWHSTVEIMSSLYSCEYSCDVDEDIGLIIHDHGE